MDDLLFRRGYFEDSDFLDDSGEYMNSFDFVEYEGDGYGYYQSEEGVYIEYPEDDVYYDYQEEEEDYYYEYPEEYEYPEGYQGIETYSYPGGHYDYFEGYEGIGSDQTEGLTEALRMALHEDYENASPEELEDALTEMVDMLSPAEGFNFRKALGTILPIAGAAVGTYLGGPLGASMGSQLGGAAGKALSGKKKRGTVKKPPKGTAAAKKPSKQVAKQTAATQKSSKNVQNGSAAAAQLLQLTQNSDVLKSLLALALGSYGKQSIKVGEEGPDVSLGAYMNLLNKLVGQALQDADELLRETEQTHDYLLDSEGEYWVDPTVPEERANALYETIVTRENQELVGHYQPLRGGWGDYFPFSAGTDLLVEYEVDWLPDPDLGKAIVVTRSRDVLKLTLYIEPWPSFNIPRTNATIEFQYFGEGRGNRAVAIVNGQRFSNDDVNIRSWGAGREISLSINILGLLVHRITVLRDKSGAAKINFSAGSKDHVLVLTPA